MEELSNISVTDSTRVVSNFRSYRHMRAVSGPGRKA